MSAAQTAAGPSAHETLDPQVIERPLVDEGLLQRLLRRAGRTLARPALCASAARLTLSAQDGDTPLHSAARWGKMEAAVALVKLGADVNAKDKVRRLSLILSF